MSAVEIYICAKGQALKEGKVEYSQSIYDKQDAEKDAAARVKRTPSVHRIAYYKVNEEGDFKILFSFTNKALDEPLQKNVVHPNKRKRKRKKTVNRSFWKRLLGLN